MMVTESNSFMNWNCYPKTEDAEIEAYAKIIKDANEKKMLEIRNIAMFNSALSKFPPKPVDIPKSEDWNSVKGQFGWTEVKKTVIPYLIRSGQKYVSQQMAEMKLFNSFHSIFTSEVFDCYRINTSPATKTEAALLNEINFRHCDNYYGSQNFVEGSPLNRLEDVIEKSEFLEFCRERLIWQNTSNSMRCGFVKIGNENCVPYVCINDKPYVPLFYFEVESNYLEERSLELGGWDLAYLRFACKIQDISKDFCNQDTVSVVELDLAKKFFFPGTTFVQCWQFENKVNHLIKETVDIMASPMNRISARNNIQEQPIHNPVTVVRYGENNLPNLGIQNQNRSNYQNPSSFVNYNNYSNCTNTNGTNSPYDSTSNTVISTNTYYPPVDIRNNYTIQSIPNVIQPSSLRRFRKPQIPKSLFQKDSNGYGVYRIQIENQVLNYCVNKEPYDGKLLLVTLEEVCLTFLKTSLESTWNAVIGLHLDIYQPNQQQLQVLQKYNIMRTRGMIRTDSLRDNLLQLIFIVNSSRVTTNVNNPG